MTKIIQECCQDGTTYWLGDEDDAVEAFGQCEVVRRGLLPPTDVIEVGSVWTHLKSRNEYVVLGVAVRESDLDILVVYQRTEDGATAWTRPIEEFLDGRFERVG